MRIYALSDLHVDFAANARELDGLSVADHVDDALIVAGDVGHQDGRIEAALAALQRRFRQVFFVPGNHELWVHGRQDDSLERCAAVLARARGLGVCSVPAWAGACWVVPLLGWYDRSLGGRVLAADLAGWADYRYCRWPPGMRSPSRHLASLNLPATTPPPAGAAPLEPDVGAPGPGTGPPAALAAAAGRERTPRHVITFSHFVPRADLLPPPSVLRFRGLPAVAGSALIEGQLRQAGAGTHVFGHSHIACDVTHDGVRYVQNALGYPRERRGRPLALKLLAEG